MARCAAADDLMANGWETILDRWQHAGLIDAATAKRIRAHEASVRRASGLRAPVLLAVALGGLLVGVAVLLFVAAHWESMSPGARFGLILALVAAFHVGAAAVAQRFAALSTVLHAVGTACLGAGIFLGGQIFNLQEHWPGGLLLWTIGAAVAWAVLRDWPQAVWVALLVPAWLGAEWIDFTLARGWQEQPRILAEGALLLSITYLTAPLPAHDTAVRKALAWVGGLAIIPASGVVIAANDSSVAATHDALPGSVAACGWILALAIPTLLAIALRRRAAWINAVAAAWVVLLGAVSIHGLTIFGNPPQSEIAQLRTYAACLIGAIGLIAWGVNEARAERINLGVAGFCITVLIFYFSSVLDKLDRSASLAGLGILFLLGGWQVERLRRRLLARLQVRS
jgi:uncharacterized membrane protein